MRTAAGKWRRHGGWAVALAVAMLACRGAGADGPTTGPATRVAMADLKLSDARPLSELQGEEDGTSLTDKLSAPQVEGTIYFGEIDTYGDGEDADPTAAVPILAVKRQGEWRAVPLAGAGLADAGWRYVGAGPGRGEVWGVLDVAAGADRAAFAVAHSTDGGQTFHLRGFRKPCRQASVYDFALARDGHGRVTLSLDADVGKHKAGLYHYDTADGGKSWAEAPRYEPDAMIRADPVDDDEQPDPAVPDPKGKAMLRGRAAVRLTRRTETGRPRPGAVAYAPPRMRSAARDGGAAAPARDAASGTTPPRAGDGPALKDDSAPAGRR